MTCSQKRIVFILVVKKQSFISQNYMHLQKDWTIVIRSLWIIFGMESFLLLRKKVLFRHFVG